MPAYQTFTSARPTAIDLPSLLATLRAMDATAGVSPDFAGGYVVKKATAWTAAQVSAVQKAIDTAPASSPELSAQAAIDTLPLVEQAIILTLIDQLNVLRAALPVPLGAISPAQAIAAVRAKAATL